VKFRIVKIFHSRPVFLVNKEGDIGGIAKSKKEREKKNLAFRRVYSKNINLKSVKTRISS